MKVLAAVVTHDRKALLSRCLDHLLGQSRKPDQILVINNGSTDGTGEMLQQRGIGSITQPNVGSAGGWARAIQYALDEGFDAVWLMDDDGFPERQALATLVPCLADDVACVSSIVVREDDPAKFVFPFPMLNSRRLPVLFATKRKVAAVNELQALAGDGTYDFAHLFNGALVNIRAARAVGNVNADFFMYGDEVDYLIRLRKFGAVRSVLNALHYHPDVTTRPYTPKSIYYYLKNTLILNRRYFDQFVLRDVATIAVVLWRTSRRNGFLTALKYIAGGSNRVLYRAIARGWAGAVGRDHEYS